MPRIHYEPTSVRGPKGFKIGNKMFGVEAGADSASVIGKARAVYIRPPDGPVYVLTPRGRAVVPPELQRAVRARYFGETGPNASPSPAPASRHLPPNVRDLSGAERLALRRLRKREASG